MFKIIKIKNRHGQGTHGIMINAKFNNLINCEIQIAVNTYDSEFMRYPNKNQPFDLRTGQDPIWTNHGNVSCLEALR